MRQTILLGLVLVSGLVWAGPPLDLESPFDKIVIFEGNYGQREKSDIRRAKTNNEHLELVKLDGSLLVISKSKVLVILPKLPPDEAFYTQQDARKALGLLESAKASWPELPETSPKTMEVWRELASRPSRHEQRLVAERGEATQRWLEKIQPEEGKPRPLNLELYIEEGERLLRAGGPEAEKVAVQVEKVRSLMAVDLNLIRGKSLATDWSELSPYMPIGIGTILSMLALWIFANMQNFGSALKSASIRTTEKRGAKSRTVNLKGFVYLVYAAVGGLLLYFLLVATPLPGLSEVSETAAGVAERAFYSSMNAQNRWSSQVKGSFEVEPAAAAAVLQKMLPTGNFVDYQVLTYCGPKVTWFDGKIFWRQTLKFLFLPLHLNFIFEPNANPFLLEKPSVVACKIGQLSIGGFLGDLLWGCFEPVTKKWDESLGLQSGVTWKWAQNSFLAETPAVIGKSDQKRQTNLGQKEKPMFKETISALELAQVFSQGHGDVYLDKTISLKGKICEVQSGRRLGNSAASEVTRAVLAKSGGQDALIAVAPFGLEDYPDAFYLSTEEAGLEGKIQVRVLVKCPHVYFLDNRGDLYRSGTNPNASDPLVARNRVALFKLGRVERHERGVIEVYGAQPPEECP